MAIYERFQTEADNPDNPDVLSGIRDVISSGMWSGGSGTLSTYFTSSTQSGSTGAYYLELPKDAPRTEFLYPDNLKEAGLLQPLYCVYYFVGVFTRSAT